jgi:hypothetical protein
MTAMGTASGTSCCRNNLLNLMSENVHVGALKDAVLLHPPSIDSGRVHSAVCDGIILTMEADPTCLKAFRCLEVPVTTSYGFYL